MKKSHWRYLLSVFCLSVTILSGGIGSAHADVDGLRLELQPDEIAMTFLNLPDGEAALIQTRENTILINTGGPKSLSVLRKLLRIYRVASISTLIITNHEIAFRSNLPELVRTYHISKILTSAPIKRDLLNPELPLSIYDVWDSKSPILMTKTLTMQKQSESPDGDLNLMVRYGNNSLLFLGNLKTFETSYMTAKKRFKARILKIGEFGTEPFKNEDLLETLDPEAAILSKKEDTAFNPELIDQLNDFMIESYNLGQVGNVTIMFTKESYEVMTFNPEQMN